MWKKIAVIGGLVAVTGLGIGGAAWAGATPAAAAAPTTSATISTTAADTSTPAAKATPAGKATPAEKAAKRKHRDTLAQRLQKVSHAQWVTKDAKTGKFVTHDTVRGTVSAVSATQLTVKATDGTSEVYLVDSATKVRVKGQAKGSTSTIAQVKVGDQVGVLGTGAGTMTATHVLDRGK